MKRKATVPTDQPAGKHQKQELTVQNDDGRSKFLHGNYDRYYGYRLGSNNKSYSEREVWQDPRLRVVKRAWFEGAKCLDIGCNAGYFTIALAEKFRVRSVLGVDIDPILIAKANKLHANRLRQKAFEREVGQQEKLASRQHRRDEIRRTLQDMDSMRAAPSFIESPLRRDSPSAVPVEADTPSTQPTSGTAASSHPPTPAVPITSLDSIGIMYLPLSLRLTMGAPACLPAPTAALPSVSPAVTAATTATTTSAATTATAASALAPASASALTPAAASASVSMASTTPTVGSSVPAPTAPTAPNSSTIATVHPTTAEALADSQVTVPGLERRVTFRTEDFMSEQHTNRNYDVITCLSVTKWIHLQRGDTGIQQLFTKIHALLRPGGVLILEPQPWRSYKKKCKLTPAIHANFKAIELKPNDFPTYLVQVIGFSRVEPLPTPAAASKGFRRPMYAVFK